MAWYYSPFFQLSQSDYSGHLWWWISEHLSNSQKLLNKTRVSEIK